MVDINTANKIRQADRARKGIADSIAKEEGAVRIQVPMSDQFAFRLHAEVLRGLADQLEALSDSGQCSHFNAVQMFRIRSGMANEQMRSNLKMGDRSIVHMNRVK